MLDPDDRDAARAHVLDQRDQLAAFVLGQAAGDLVEQQQRAAWSPARAPAPAACDRAASDPPARRWPCRPARSVPACRRSVVDRAPRARRRRRPRPPARSRTRSCRRTAAGSGTSARAPGGSACSGGSRVMSSPSKSDAAARPAPTVPVAMSNSVVLPAPFGPMMPSASPSCEREIDAVGDHHGAEALVDLLEREDGGHAVQSTRCHARRERGIQVLQRSASDGVDGRA